MRYFLVIMFLVFSAGCGPAPEKSASKAEEKRPEGDYLIASIGEAKIFFSEIKRLAEGLNKFLKENFQTSKEWRLNYIRQYVAVRVLASRALRAGLDKDKDVILAIENSRESILANKMLGDRLALIRTTEEDLKNYYSANMVKYQIGEKIKVSYLRIKSKDEADNARIQLNQGKTFSQTAGKKAIKVNEWIQKDSGAMDPVLGNIPPEAFKSLFSLGVGASSQPIEANSEYYIFHIDEKEPAKDKPFEEVRKQVEFDYSTAERDKVMNEFVKESFDQEKAKIYEEEIANKFSES